MAGKFNNVGDKLLHSDHLVFTFLRSTVASQTASWADMFTGFALYAWVGLTSFLATAIGAFVGGVINCVINYRFTFHAYDCPWRAVIVKYLMVWTGSMLLNSFGTQALDNWLTYMDLFDRAKYASNINYAIARVTVSLIVSLFWNFLLQRTFVYRPTRFDKYALRMLDLVGLRGR